MTEQSPVLVEPQENQKKSKLKTKWTPTYKEVHRRAKKKVQSASATTRSFIAGAMQANLLWGNELVLLFPFFLLLTFVFAALIAFLYSRDRFKPNFFQEGFLFFTTRIFCMYAVVLFVGFTVIAILKNQLGKASFTFILYLLGVLFYSIMIYAELPFTCYFLLRKEGCAFKQDRSAIEELQSNIYEIIIQAAVKSILEKVIPANLPSGLLTTSGSVFLHAFMNKWNTGLFCPSIFTNDGECTTNKDRENKYLYSFMKDAIFRLENGQKKQQKDTGAVGVVATGDISEAMSKAFTFISKCSGITRMVALFSGLLPSAAFYTHVLDTNLFEEHFRHNKRSQIDEVRSLLQKEGIFCTFQDAFSYFVLGNTKRVKEGWTSTLKLLQMKREKKTELKNLLLEKNLDKGVALIDGEKIPSEKIMEHKTKLDWPTYKFVKDNSGVLKKVFRVVQDWGEEEVTLNDDDLKTFLGLNSDTFFADQGVQDNIWHLITSFEGQRENGSACSLAKSRPFHNILTQFSSDGCFTAKGYPRTCLF